MNCREYRALIDDALDVSLKDSLEQRVKLHLDHCPACRNYYESCRQEHVALFSVMNSAYADIRLPSNFADRVLSEIVAGNMARKRSFFVRMPRWALIAASLVLMAGFVFAATVVVDAVIANGDDSKRTEETQTTEGADGGAAPAVSTDVPYVSDVASVPSSSSAENQQTINNQQSTTDNKLKEERAMTKRKAAAAALTAAMAAAPLAAADGDGYQFIISGYPVANYSHTESSSAITLNAGAVPVAGAVGDLEARKGGQKWK